MSKIARSFLVLSISLTTLAASATPIAIMPTDKQLAEKLIKNQHDTAQLTTFAEQTRSEVIKEIETEAALANMDRDKYIDSDISYQNFIADIKETDASKLDRASLIVLIAKIGERTEIQESVRFPSSFQMHAREQIQPVYEKLIKQLGDLSKAN